MHLYKKGGLTLLIDHATIRDGRLYKRCSTLYTRLSDITCLALIVRLSLPSLAFGHKTGQTATFSFILSLFSLLRASAPSDIRLAELFHSLHTPLRRVQVHSCSSGVVSASSGHKTCQEFYTGPYWCTSESIHACRSQDCCHISVPECHMLSKDCRDCSTAVKTF